MTIEKSGIIDIIAKLVRRISRLESVRNDSIAVKDGMTPPATIAGVAQFYVDTSDGDLKVKFGDGTIKTIVTDS